MFLSDGSIKDVVDWFHGQWRFKYLLLFVPGDLDGRHLLDSVFEHKETIDLVSAEDIVVLLFQDGDTAIEVQPHEGHRLWLQGMRFDDPKRGWTPPWKPMLRQVHISEVPANLKERVARTSVTVAAQAVEYFGLEPEDVPSLLLLSRSHPEPVVVRTRGQADVQALLKFIRDVRAIVLPHVELPKKKKKEVRKRLRAARAHTADARRTLHGAVEVWRAQLLSRGLSERRLEASLTPDNALDVWDISGAKEKSGVPVALRGAYDMLQEALADDRFRTVCEDVEKAAYLYASHQRSAEKLEKLIERYGALLSRTETELRALSGVEETIQRLAASYERRFRVRQASKRISEFVTSVIGVGKRAKELSDAREQLLALLGD